MRRLREHPIRRYAVPLPRVGNATKQEYRFPRIVSTNTRICGKTISTDKAFPDGEGNEEAAWPQKRKPIPPRCARQPLPREGARVVIPSFLWKEVPRRGGGWMGKRYERQVGKIVSSTPFTRAPYPPLRSAAPSPRETGRAIHFSFTNFHLSMI